jgi:hypothetical protein
MEKKRNKDDVMLLAMLSELVPVLSTQRRERLREKERKESIAALDDGKGEGVGAISFTIKERFNIFYV